MISKSFQELSREELYEKVWNVSGVKLSEEWGVSDVAISKRCRKLNIPRPSRGHWAKIEAGQKLKRPPLPPTPEQIFSQEARKPIGKALVWPVDSDKLHPLAADLFKELKAANLSYDKKRVHLRERALPEAEISKELAERAAQAFHALLGVIESRGIKFGRSQSSYEGGHFRKSHDRLFFKIEEELVDKLEPTKGRRSYSSSPYANKVPSGKLAFTISSERYGSSKRQGWMESEKTPLGVILAQIAKFICDHFVEAQDRREAEVIEREKQRVESEIRWKKHLEEEAVRKEEEAKKRHAEKLEEIASARSEDLAKAAEWWRLYESAMAFIAECERRWATTQTEVTPEQREWLKWAHGNVKKMSPFELGYPDPVKDGTFDPASVPFGGPYPETREFPKPSSMPEIPAPIVVQQSYGSSNYQPAPKPYPFWLKHRRK